MAGVGIRFVLDPPLTSELRDQIVTLWTAVTNAGGAVGFVGPVTEDDVRPLALATLRDAAEGLDRMLVGFHRQRRSPCSSSPTTGSGSRRTGASSSG